MQNLSVSVIRSFVSPQVISSPQTLKQMEGTYHHSTRNFNNHKNRLNRPGWRADISMEIDYYSLEWCEINYNEVSITFW